ncbi:uncharacterized protein LOC111383434 [Olea europaea var. sylvestris]|uniref:uncharacterized protein LOC111383434 n=1 Tax=Olea europaea var. sylvestris TaxID=158386 RepID=UPI000C1D4503|nr:uncharacterized protein LOC111383434 [Olea europaea var. sylvestris]
MRSQEYDGANNIQGARNGLQALFLRDCPYVYYIHCFAHRLQFVLVYAAKEVDVMWEFFSHLDNIINIITSFPKCITELQSTQGNEIEYMLATRESESRSGANQVGNLQRSGATRWSSHYDSIKSLIDMYNATSKTFENLNALQRKSQDILTAMKFVSTTTKLLHKLRDDDWEEFLEEVKKFCSKHDYILMELNTRFNDTSVELLTLSAALDSRDSFASFNSLDICALAEKFYPKNFSSQDIRTLEYELRHYELERLNLDFNFSLVKALFMCL